MVTFQFQILEILLLIIPFFLKVEISQELGGGKMMVIVQVTVITLIFPLNSLSQGQYFFMKTR